MSIGLTINKEIVVGIIYNPMLDEMYTATKDGGAFCNGNRIRVSGQEGKLKTKPFSFLFIRHADLS